MGGQFGAYVDGAPEAQPSANGTPDGHDSLVPSSGGPEVGTAEVGRGTATGDGDGDDTSTMFRGPAAQPSGGR